MEIPIKKTKKVKLLYMRDRSVSLRTMNSIFSKEP